MTDQNRKKIDELLQIRQNGIFNYSKATRELINLGVKIGRKSDGALTIPSNFQPFLDRYNVSNLEFEWLAEYKDGTKLAQYEGEKSNHFGHIDQTKLKSLAFISNFNWQTDNQEKRVIVKLNWETGLFEFMNGFASQDVVEYACTNPLAGDRQLIMFIRKQYGFTAGDIKDDYKEFIPNFDEFFYYNRFVLGYKIPGGEKKVLIIEPTGNINIFQN